MRIVRGTGKPIAQVVGDFGINEGTMANWIARDRMSRVGDVAIEASDRTLARGDRGTLRTIMGNLLWAFA